MVFDGHQNRMMTFCRRLRPASRRSCYVVRSFDTDSSGNHQFPRQPLACIHTGSPETEICGQPLLARISGSLDTTELIDLRDYVLLHMLWDTGMHAGELVNLTLDNLDQAWQTLRITHATFGEWRDIGFGKEAHKYLTRYLALCLPKPAMEGDWRLFLASTVFL